MKQPLGWPLIAGIGLACVASALALIYWSNRSRNSLPSPSPAPAQVQKRAVAQLPVARIADGPPMLIEPEDLARAGKERNDNGLKMKFRWCPPGAFHMGSSPLRIGRSLAGGPVGVTIRQGFWMGQFEVTQSEWRRVMGLTLREQRARDPSQPRPVGDGTKRDHVGEGPDFPIYFTSHGDAEEFCHKFTSAEREAGRLEQGWAYPLPTEAQWEFACRAGTTTATAFGDQLSGEQANFDGSMPLNGAPAGPYLHETTPVGRYPANRWGLHDMHGNVWEWCRDGFTETPAGGIDPFEPSSSNRRTYRGGCWHNPGSLCLSTTRGYGEPDNRGSGLGFRVALVRIENGNPTEP